MTPGSVGNPDLKPEVGSELEIGLDAGFFGNRMVIELTHFRQHMTDVILSTRVAPSSGFASAQDVNAGIVNNTGYEFTLAVKPIVTRSVELDQKRPVDLRALRGLVLQQGDQQRDRIRAAARLQSRIRRGQPFVHAPRAPTSLEP